MLKKDFQNVNLRLIIGYEKITANSISSVSALLSIHELFALPYSFMLADKYKFDVKKIVFEKIRANAIKYPVHKAKGTLKKYNEL